MYILYSFAILTSLLFGPKQIMACMLASFSEGLTLADRSGLSKQDLIKILSLGAMQNPMFNMKGPKIVADGASARRGIYFPCVLRSNS